MTAWRVRWQCVLAAAALGGCKSAPTNEVWTTKNESMLGASAEIAEANTAIPSRDLPEVDDPAALRLQAIEHLKLAADSPNPQVRANALEALEYAPDQLEPSVQRALGDENRGIRFVAAMTAGKLKLRNLAPLIEPLLHDESESVQAAAIYALHRCDRQVDLNPLASMLQSEDPEVKGNAALVLGELGEPTAIGMLRDSVGKGIRRTAAARRKVVELQLAEAMVKLGASNQIDVIRAALFAPAEEGELVALACQMCGELRDVGALADLLNLVNRTGRLRRPPEIRLAALQAIGEIDPVRAPVEVAVAHTGSAHADLRGQAAHCLGAIGRYGGGSGNAATLLPYLAKMMEDQSPLVQIAAARAILRVQPG
ncbi:MAG: HEAT repeat domain-containing protein [Phycisphaerales bacterium]|nr:HEAT repeat domain-containing protein [Phycisphaerales bacterium]